MFPGRELIEGAAKVAISWEKLPWDDAIDFLKRKNPMTRENFDALEGWAKSKAFTMAGVAKMDVLQRTLDALTRAMEKGETLKDFASSVEAFLDDAGLSPIDPWRIETIFRTNVQSAYGRGQWNAFQEGQDNTSEWGWRYRTVGDDRVRESHAALDGQIFEGSDGAEFWPPWDFNCRCHAETISTAEAIDEGLEATGKIPDEAWEDLSDFASPALGVEWRPDLTKYAPTIVSDFVADESRRGPKQMELPMPGLETPPVKEWKGGEWPEEVVDSTNEAIGDLVTRTSDQGHEWATFIDPESGTVREPYTSNHPTEVDLPDDAHRYTGWIHLHTHPAHRLGDGTRVYDFDKTLSANDVRVAMELNSAETIAATEDGELYGMTRVGETWPTDRFWAWELDGRDLGPGMGDGEVEIPEEWGAGGWANVVREELAADVRAGKLTNDQADREYWSRLWKKVSAQTGGKFFVYWERK